MELIGIKIIITEDNNQHVTDYLKNNTVYMSFTTVKYSTITQLTTGTVMVQQVIIIIETRILENKIKTVWWIFKKSNIIHIWYQYPITNIVPVNFICLPM